MKCQSTQLHSNKYFRKNLVTKPLNKRDPGAEHRAAAHDLVERLAAHVKATQTTVEGKLIRVGAVGRPGPRQRVVWCCRDADRNVIVYKGSKAWERGQTVACTARVKAHDNRDGVPQTIIQRPTGTSITITTTE